MATKIQDLPENTAPFNTWHTLADDGAGNTYKVPLENVPASALHASTTINFVNTESVADMQAKIDAVPKNLNGYNLIFQFGNGTYSLGSGGDRIFFTDFFGAGQLIIQGDRTEANADDLHTTQNVILDGSTLNNEVIKISGVTVSQIYVQNLHIKHDAVNGFDGIEFQYCPSYCEARYNYFVGNNTATQNSAGVMFFRSGPSYAQENYVSGQRYGLRVADTTSLRAVNNDDTGTPPDYGLQSQSGIIFKAGTQPSGGTAAEHTSGGGQIF